MLGLDVNASAVQCTVEDGGVRLGLGYIKDVVTAEASALVAERERNGPFASLAELAGRAGVRRGTLEQLAWSGACDGLMAATAAAEPRSLGGRGIQTGATDGVGHADRRSALWQLGMATSAETVGVEEGTQLALPLELPAAPRLRSLGRWQRLIADYATSGVTVGDHAMAILRERLDVPKCS